MGQDGLRFVGGAQAGVLLKQAFALPRRKLRKILPASPEETCPRAYKNITVVHGGLSVGGNRRMKVEFPKATSSPLGDHFSTSNILGTLPAKSLVSEKELIEMGNDRFQKGQGTLEQEKGGNDGLKYCQ